MTISTPTLNFNPSPTSDHIHHSSPRLRQSSYFSVCWSKGTSCPIFSEFRKKVKAGKMSRHKLVKNLDLDNELDDFDGGEDYDDGAGGEGRSTLSRINIKASKLISCLQS
jgi:hypothetical protein